MMKFIFEPDSEQEANELVTALQNRGINVFLEGQKTKSLGGFFVPNVLRLYVIQDEQYHIAKKTIAKTLQNQKKQSLNQSKKYPIKKSDAWIILIGLGFFILPAILFLIAVLFDFLK
ncbi:MAG: hypothetical protein ACK44V_01755 [Burkholderiales bacterium]